MLCPEFEAALHLMMPAVKAIELLFVLSVTAQMPFVSGSLLILMILLECLVLKVSLEH